MSALAAAAIVAAAGVEPILHMITRDRNRIALVADCLGAQALGVRNILCTSGTHQILGRFRAARNVFDIDSTQLLQLCAGLAGDGAIVGEERIEAAGPFCLGAVASPGADPLEMQVMRLAKKVAAGAKFVITQPVFDRERFDLWWQEVTRRGLHEKAAIVAGIQILTDAESARAYAAKPPLPMVPQVLLERLASRADESEQRAEGIEIAQETIDGLASVEGLRGFEIRSDDDSAVGEIVENLERGI